jgi:phage-related protein
MAESPTMEVRARLTADSAQFTKGLSEATKSAETFQSAAQNLNKVLVASGAVAGGFAIAMLAFGTKSFKAAAEVQQLDVALQALGQSTRYGYTQLALAVEEIKSVGISSTAAQRAVIKLAQSNVDLADAQSLATIAQNLSVTSSVNSADAMNTLIFAITTGQTRMLRQIGITAGATEAYAVYGRTIGKAASDLTMAERRQAVLNLIIKEGAKVNGAYAIAMQNPSRALQEMADNTRKLQEAVGKRLLSSFTKIILSVFVLTDKFQKAANGTGAFSKYLDAMEMLLTKLADPFAKIAENIGNFIEKIDKSEVSVKSIASSMEKLLPIAVGFTTFFGIKAGQSLAQAAPFFQGFFNSLAKYAGLFTAFTVVLTSPQIRNALGQVISAFKPLLPVVQQVGAVLAVLSALITGVISKALSGLASIIRTITNFFTNNATATQILTTALQGIAIVVGLATVAFYAHVAALKIVTFTQALLAVGTVLLSGGQLSSIASTNGLAASMLKLNATMAANPIMRVVLIVGLLVTAIVTAYKNFETFRKVVNAVFNFVAKIVTVVLAGIITYYGHLLKTLAQVIRVFGFFAEVIAKVFEFVLDVILNFAKFVYTTYKNVIDAFITLMETNETFRKVVETVFNTIIRIIALAVTLIVTSFANILKAIATGIYIFEKLLEVAKTIVKGIIAGFVILGKGIFNIFKTVASGIGNFLGDALDTVKGWVMSLINLLSKIPGVDKLLQSVVASLNNFGSSFVNNLKNIGGKLSDALFGSTEKGSEQSIDAITKVSKTLITNAKSWGNYSEGAAGAISNVANKMLDFNMKVVDLAAKDNGSKIVEGLIAGAKKASPFLEKIIAGLGTALKFDFAGTIGKFIDSVADKADEAGDKLIEFGKNMVIFAQNANFPEEIKDFIGNIRESLEEGLGFGDILKKEKDKADAIKAGGIDEDALNDIQGSADLMAKIREAMKAGIESMSDVLKDLQQAAKDFADSLKDTILGFAGLKSVELPDGFIPKAKSLIENMQTRLNKSNQFAQQITQLQALGLDAKAIQDLVESGPIKGAQLAASILGGGVDAIKQINEIQKAISITGAAIGKFGSEAAFGDKIANAQLKLAQVTDAEARISGVSGNNIVIEQGAFVVNVDTTGATNQDEKADIITQRIQETFAILAKELANK